MSERSLPPISVTQLDVDDKDLLRRLLEKAVGQINHLVERIDQLESAPKPASVAAIRRELAAGGPNQLSISRLPGVAGEAQYAKIVVKDSALTSFEIQQLSEGQLVREAGTLKYVVKGTPKTLANV